MLNGSTKGIYNSEVLVLSTAFPHAEGPFLTLQILIVAGIFCLPLLVFSGDTF